jgi:hypothetical protein
MSLYDFAHQHEVLVFCAMMMFVLVVRELRYLVRRPEDEDLEEPIVFPAKGHDAADHDTCQVNACDFKTLHDAMFTESFTEATPNRARQRLIATWCRETFGVENATNPVERGLRVLEEAAELAQALGVPEHTAGRLLVHVYQRPVGDVGQEVAGVLVTTLAAATAVTVDAEEVLCREVVRIHGPELRERLKQKNLTKVR